MTIVNFFWSRQHWLRAVVLSVQEGGQVLIDIFSSVAVFCLYAVQSLLYHQHHQWMDVVCAHKGGRMGLDKHLCTVYLEIIDLKGLTTFYQSVLQVWQTLSFLREWERPIRWLYKEPLFRTVMLRSTTIRIALMEAGFSKIGHLRKDSSWLTPKKLAAKVGFNSVCLAQHMLDYLAVFPAPPKTHLMRALMNFLTFLNSLNKEGWQEDVGKLLFMDIPKQPLRDLS